VDLSTRPDMLAAASQQQAPLTSQPTPSKRKKGLKAAPPASGSDAARQLQCTPGSVQEGIVEHLQGAPMHYAVVSLPQVCVAAMCSHSLSKCTHMVLHCHTKFPLYIST
jgi:hypothetical protein